MGKSTSNGDHAPAGISIRNGPVIDEMDIDQPVANSKRKARVSAGKTVNYNEAGSAGEEDEKPLVCCSILGDASMRWARNHVC